MQPNPDDINIENGIFPWMNTIHHNPFLWIHERKSFSGIFLPKSIRESQKPLSESSYLRILEFISTELMTLPKNWDGNNSGPIPKVMVDNTREVLKELFKVNIFPEITPCGDGTVLLEFIDWKIYIDEPNSVTFVRNDQLTEVEEYSRLKDLINGLTT